MDLNDFQKFAFIQFGLKEVVYLAGQDSNQYWHILASRVQDLDRNIEGPWEISKEEAFAILL